MHKFILLIKASEALLSIKSMRRALATLSTSYFLKVFQSLEALDIIFILNLKKLFKIKKYNFYIFEKKINLTRFIRGEGVD